MGEPKSITWEYVSGICIEFIKSRHVIRVHVWHDERGGAKVGNIALVDFCRKLGISKRELLRVVQELEEAKE